MDDMFTRAKQAFLARASPVNKPEKALIDRFVNDEKADWLLHKAQYTKGPKKLSATLNAARQLGELQAELISQPNVPILHWGALRDVCNQNSLGVGMPRARLERVLRSAINKGFRHRARELAGPLVEKALGPVRNTVQFVSDDDGDRADLLDTMCASAADIATYTNLAPATAFRQIAEAAGLKGADLRWAWKPIQREMRMKQREREEIRSRANAKAFDLSGTVVALHIGPRPMTDPFATGGKARFAVTFLDDIEPNPVKHWLVDDFLGEGEFTCFWGMPGCGKSVAVGDAAFHVAAGLDWFGKPVRSGLVVYVAAERAELTKRRFAALRKIHDRRNVPLAVLTGRLDFTSGSDDARDIVQAVRGAEEKSGKRCVWLIIDTVARTFGAGDENAAKDMGGYVQNCDYIRQELGSAHLSLVHHCSRTGEKPRGSIALDGAVDATFKVSKNGELHAVVTDKENDAPEAPPIRFRMKSVELGTDHRGKLTTAPIVEPDNDSIISISTPDGLRVVLGRQKAPRKGVTAFLAALDREGQEHPNGRRAVSEEVLKGHLRDAFGSSTVKEASLAAIVRREIRALVEKGDAERIGDWFLSTTMSSPHFED